jgi:hypothetical protein
MTATAGKHITRTHALGTARWGRDPLEVLAYVASAPLPYRTLLSPIESAPTSEGEIIERFARRREHPIHEASDDWLWMHRRWRDRPAERAAREASRG